MIEDNTVSVVKMVGTAGWGFLFDNCPGTIRRGILRDERRTLVLDMAYAGRDYSVNLQRQAGDRFEGTWQRTKSPAISGVAAATLYTSSTGELLFGEWREDNKVYYWWVELTVVERFPDEKA